MSLSSADMQRQSELWIKASPNISIIVPVLDESHRIRPFLEHLRERAPGVEIIVVNATGSQSVPQSTATLCDQVLTTRRGRAAQMNAGAKAAHGDVFWFVHADCQVPSNCLVEIARVLADPRIVGGCFRIRFPRRELVYRVSDAGGNLAVELFGRCYGDHGIFCRREDFMAIGGYPDVPLFEDAEFSGRLRRRGRTRQFASKIITSPRRYENIGPYRLTAAYLLLSMLYFLGISIALLARIYNYLCRSADVRARAPR